MVLHIALREARYCRGPQPDQHVRLIVCVSLEVAAQGSHTIGIRHAVSFAGEMIDSDLSEPVPREQLLCRLKQVHARLGIRQGIGGNKGLTLCHPWHMGIAVKRHTVW